MVSTTYTLNDSYGSGVTVKGAGFLLNDEMDDFALKAGTPNAFGVIGFDANAVAPGKRPRSSMSPVVVLRQDTGELVAALGSPGGTAILAYNATEAGQISVASAHWR